MKYKRTNLPYKKWAGEFIKEVKENRYDSNTVSWYRFRISDLRIFVAYKRDAKGWWSEIVGSENAIINSLLYHIKKQGFKKSSFQLEYKLLKKESDKSFIKNPNGIKSEYLLILSKL